MNPIFIGGCERSGTTMLASLMAGNKDFLVTPESQFKVELFNHSDEKNYRKKIVDKLNSNFRFKLWGLDLDEIEGSNSAEFIENLLKLYAQEKAIGETQYWIDHTPNNFQFFHEISEVWPNAKFIHIVRDGRAIYNSMKGTDWGAKNSLDASLMWTRKLSFAFLSELNCPNRVLTIRYEDLFTSLSRVESRLRKFLSISTLSLAPQNAQDYFLPDYTRRQHSLVGKSLDISRINNWKEKLTKREIELFEHNCHMILKTFNYELIYAARARGASSLEKKKIKISSFFKYRIAFIRNKIRKKLNR